MACLEFWFVGEKEYYERQFATLKSFEEVDCIEESDSCNSVDEDNQEQAQQEWAMKISNYANVALLILKVYFIWISCFHFVVASCYAAHEYARYVKINSYMFGCYLAFTVDFSSKINFEMKLKKQLLGEHTQSWNFTIEFLNNILQKSLFDK